MRRIAAACIAAAASCQAVPAAAQAPAPRSLALIAAHCANCHGADGRGRGAMPSLAGVPKARLVDALQQFRDGRREATVMHQHAKGYTEPELEALAEHFARQPSAR